MSIYLPNVCLSVSWIARCVTRICHLFPYVLNESVINRLSVRHFKDTTQRAVVLYKFGYWVCFTTLEYEDLVHNSNLSGFGTAQNSVDLCWNWNPSNRTYRTLYVTASIYSYVCWEQMTTKIWMKQHYRREAKRRKNMSKFFCSKLIHEGESSFLIYNSFQPDPTRVTPPAPTSCG